LLLGAAEFLEGAEPGAFGGFKAAEDLVEGVMGAVLSEGCAEEDAGGNAGGFPLRDEGVIELGFDAGGDGACSSRRG
jgi:hypothetical protein